MGDFNGDGRPDLAVANGDGNVSVLLNKGDGTFADAVNFPAGKALHCVVVADFNHDRKLDLAVSDRDGRQVCVLLGNGDGSFREAVPFAVPGGSYDLVAAHVDGDGKIDLVAAPLESGACILLSNGDGTFRKALAVGTMKCRYLVTADLDGDGRLDLAVVDNNLDKVGIYSGNGDGSFRELCTLAVSRGPSGLAVGDFNGDGKLDLVTANRNGNNVSVLLHRPGRPYQAHFGPAIHYAVGKEPRGVAVGDLDRDGKADLAVADFGDDAVRVLRGNGDGTFATAVRYPVGKSPVAVALGDFDRDGSLDLVVANSKNNSVSVLRSKGNGELAEALHYPVGENPSDVAVADINGDGKLDLVVANYDSKSVSILPGNGDGTFKPAQSFFAGGNARSVAVGDFNGDGKLDLVVANRFQVGTVSVLLGKGDGSFADAVSYSTGAFPIAVVVGDFNGDGKLDLVVANYASSDVNLLLGNGDGTFRTAVNFIASGNTITVANGMTLSIGAGQIIKSQSGGLTIDGTLNVQGTAASPVVFTSLGDDTVGGDTNNDHSNSTPNHGDWSQLQLNADSSNNVLDYVQVYYAGSFGAPAIYDNGGPMTLSNSVVTNNNSVGVRLFKTDATLSANTFQNNDGAAMSMDLDSNPTITGDDEPMDNFNNNGNNGMLVDGGTTLESLNWNNPDIVYTLSNNVTVANGMTLTIGAGQIIKSGNLTIDGTLIAQGTATSPIIFTSLRDDNFGGDTNNDNGSNSPHPGDWGGLQFNNDSSNNMLDHVEIFYAGAFGSPALNANGGPLTLSDSLVSSVSAPDVNAVNNAQVQLTNDVLSNSNQGIVANSGAVMTAFNNTTDGNGTGVQINTATVTLTNNLITNSSSAGINKSSNGTVNMSFNDVYNPGSGAINYSGLASQTGTNNNISVDPGYVNRAQLQYQPSADSAVRGAGTSTGAPTTDFFSNPRPDPPTIGAFEAGSQLATPTLTLTPAAVAAGFTLDVFAYNFPTYPTGGQPIGPLGIAFTASGGVMVSDYQGNVRVFPTDTDGQNADDVPPGGMYGADNTLGLARVGSSYYVAQYGFGNSPQVSQLNADGSFNQVIVPVGALGLVANPANGHLLITSAPNIVDIDPIAKTSTILISGLTTTVSDGLAISADGGTLYVANNATGNVFGFATGNGPQTLQQAVFNSGFIENGIDGVALGSGSFARDLFVNTNAGNVWEVNLDTNQKTLLATGGSRGDFATLDPSNGSILLTQSTEIDRLIPPSMAAPTVASLSVSAGSTAGGTALTITGTNLANATEVDFGAVRVTSFTTDSANSITLNTPAAAAGTVDVRVITANGTSAVNSPADNFTFGPPVALSPTGTASILTGSSLAVGTVGVSYQQTISATGGTGTVTLAVSDVQNPIADLNLPANGTGSISITGTPSLTGVETFTITATDANGLQDIENYVLKVGGFTTSPPPDGTLGTPYSFTYGFFVGAAKGIFASKNVGTNLVVTVSGLLLGAAQAANYTVTQPTTTANITTLALTVTGVTANNKVYDGTTAATLNVAAAQLHGVITGDTVTLGTTHASGTFASRNVGTGITATVAGLSISGSAASNYTLTPPTTMANITPRPITVTAVADTKTYDGSTVSYQTPTITSGSVATGDTAGFTQTFNTASVGTGETLTASGTVNDGNSGKNYVVTFVANTHGAINKATLIVQAINVTWIIGQPRAPLTYEISGFVSGDSPGIVIGSPVLSTTATSSSGVGSYTITISQSTLSSSTYAFQFVDGTLTVELPPG